MVKKLKFYTLLILFFLSIGLVYTTWSIFWNFKIQNKDGKIIDLSDKWKITTGKYTQLENQKPYEFQFLSNAKETPMGGMVYEDFYLDIILIKIL
jgi:hypothetical protein